MSDSVPRRPSSRGCIGGALLFALALALVLSAPTHGAAQDHELRVSSLEVGGWPETVATLEADRGAQGSAVHIVVLDNDGHRASCGRYSLALDELGARAFTIGACDSSSSATELVLRSRADLFSHDGPVPRPRVIRLVATEVRYADAAGGAGVTGGAALDCSVGVRPFLDDLEHGGVVYLRSDRYEVRPTQTTVQVSVEPDGWSLHARSATSLSIDYDVVDRTTHEVVLSDHAMLSCGTGPSSPTPAATQERGGSARASHVLMTDTGALSRAAEVVSPLEVREPHGDERTARETMQTRAAALGADAVVGVMIHRAADGSLRLSGTAVRYVDLTSS